MARKVENVQWIQRRPRWYIERLRNVPTPIKEPIRQREDYREKYVGLGTVVFYRRGTDEFISEEEYRKLR